MINYRNGMGIAVKLAICIFFCELFLIAFFYYQNRIEQKTIDDKKTGIEMTRNLYRGDNGN